VGFEPTVGFHPRSVSNRVLSASQPRLQRTPFNHLRFAGQGGKGAPPHMAASAGHSPHCSPQTKWPPLNHSPLTPSPKPSTPQPNCWAVVTVSKKISWSGSSKAKRKKTSVPNAVVRTNILVRPYAKKTLLVSATHIDRPGVLKQWFPNGSANSLISINGVNSRASFCVVSAAMPVDLHIGDTKDGYQCLPKCRYSAN
jgi:Type ISP C-terminal specificity domain